LTIEKNFRGPKGLKFLPEKLADAWVKKTDMEKFLPSWRYFWCICISEALLSTRAGINT